MPGENNPFTDIILVLEDYENTAANLIDNQRDHFVHAVNVFLTGLSIYISNVNYRNAFESTVLNGVYKDCYSIKRNSALGTKRELCLNRVNTRRKLQKSRQTASSKRRIH